uniref:Secreted protein n=1 Tax=Heterorhabditis bacteriophora TaxID=37862 RepID=A0A1I7XPB1_HETBA
MEQAGIVTLNTPPQAAATTTRPRQQLMCSLFWMTIVEQLSIGRVWQEEGERNGDAFWFLNGTDLSLQIALPMTYTTRPSQYFSDQ